jgi:hypothetical protein
MAPCSDVDQHPEANDVTRVRIVKREGRAGVRDLAGSSALRGISISVDCAFPLRSQRGRPLTQGKAHR